MKAEPRIIEFIKTEKISFDLYVSYEIRVKVSVNLETNAAFKLTSSAFNGKGYRVTVPVNDPDVTVKVMFTHPGAGQEIKLIPLLNCQTGKESVLKADVAGERKDFNDLNSVIDYNDKVTIPCNMKGIILSCLCSGRQINSFTIEKLTGNKFFQVNLKELSDAGENISYELLCGLSRYNSAYYTLDFNRVPFKEYELLTALNKAEAEWELEQKEKQKKFALLETNIREKNFLLYLNNNSIIQLTSGTREENDHLHISEIEIKPKGGYFCKSHPFVTVREYRSDRSSEQENTFSQSGNNVKFAVYQCYPFTDFDKVTINSSENNLIAQSVQLLKEFRNRHKLQNIYGVEILSCGFPDVLENVMDKPVSRLTTNIHVYPSDEYALFFESLPKGKVNIETAIYDRKKVKFYIKKDPLLEIEEKKAENSSYSEKVNYIENYSKYPDLNVLNLSIANKENNTVASGNNFENISTYYNYLNHSIEQPSADIAKISLYRNGKSYNALERYDTFAKYITSLRQKLQTAFLNLISICYTQDYSLELSVDAMNGVFFEKWGIKEYLDNNVFHWKKIFSNLDIFRYRFNGEFAGFWGKGQSIFKGIVSIASSGHLSYSDDYEKSFLDSSYRYYKNKSKNEFDIRLFSVLSDDNAISSGKIKRYGIEGEIERSFQLEEQGNELQYSIKIPGVVAEIVHKNPLFKTSVYDKSFSRDYIGGELVEKSVFPALHFRPWFALQTKYETSYGLLLKLSNNVKEALFNLYYFQIQMLKSRSWLKNSNEIQVISSWKNALKIPVFDANGMMIYTSSGKENEENNISLENQQWGLFMDGINRKIITSMPTSSRIRDIYKYLKECKDNFILDNNYEDLKLGQVIFNSILLVMSITDFLEKKLNKLNSMMNSLEMEYKNLIELSRDEKLKESADSYDEMEKEAAVRFNALLKEIDISSADSTFDLLEVDDMKNLLSNLNFEWKNDFGYLEKFCDSISFVSEILENCLNSRTYWLSGINRPAKIKTIFGR